MTKMQSPCPIRRQPNAIFGVTPAAASIILPESGTRKRADALPQKRFVEGFPMKKKKSAPKPTTGLCAVCQGEMKHIRTIPAAGFMAEMYTFRCTVCGCPRTEEKSEQPAVEISAAA
jgi:hypothetical protein